MAGVVLAGRGRGALVALTFLHSSKTGIWLLALPGPPLACWSRQAESPGWPGLTVSCCRNDPRAGCYWPRPAVRRRTIRLAAFPWQARKLDPQSRSGSPRLDRLRQATERQRRASCRTEPEIRMERTPGAYFDWATPTLLLSNHHECLGRVGAPRSCAKTSGGDHTQGLLLYGGPADGDSSAGAVA